ncbi:peptide-methionine (S)-S-oxide reductase MsrA [Erythrobacter rubeus]|uniref:Peptide methionine sulfoxide reductase MsrA n=1 Tax=Erythrobacter rubeus TaxID=2760803 RepID=A0ABR8KPT9_9SPHN|nr:peptide-methionine (S)-S-oxide reductase MsrA [Erythrobacter rubeus]MBD2842732.1 peptide-methionine (S)-S-oxide reductase MsrA [Erythrobacter rubeus]
MKLPKPTLFAKGVLTAAAIALSACAYQAPADGKAAEGSTKVSSADLPENQATAVFAMGCFWCAEADFEKVEGVIDVVSGYTGGDRENPTYRQVTFGDTGHYEAILVTYDETKVTYDELLSVFWKNIDPFDAAGQFCDKGSSYRAAVFPESDSEREAAEGTKDTLEAKLGREFATMVIDRDDFYLAEEYHQDYYKKNPVRYRVYRSNCGRDRRLAQVWSDAG